MRIRTIKPEFFLHEGLYELELETGLPIRISFAGLWCIADREGRFKWEPRKIGVQVLPYDLIDFSRVLDALTTRGFVLKYASENEAFGCIPSFGRHQVINNRERDSDLPNPSDCDICDASTTRESRVPTRGQSCKEEGKGREQGREGIPPNPQGGNEGNQDSLFTDPPKPTVLPANWQRMSEKDRKRTKVFQNNETMKVMGAWFGRKPETLWTVAEAVALIATNPPQKEIDGMGRYYSAQIADGDFRRHDLLTLLNNWTSELDRARKFITTQSA